MLKNSDNIFNMKTKLIVKHPRDGIVTPIRLWSAWQIADNWRLWHRLPRLTKFGKRIGIIKEIALDETI